MIRSNFQFAIRYVPVSIALLTIVAGCGQSPDASQQSSLEQIIDIDSKSDVESDAATENQKSESKFEADFTRLSGVALAFEKEQKWNEAIAQWQLVIDLTSAEFGVDSWQTRNAKLAVEIAKKRQSFTDVDRANSDKIAELQRTTRQFLQQGKIVDAIAQSQKTIDLAREVWGADSHVTANFDEQHAQLLRASGNYQVAVDYFLETIRKREKSLSKVHPDYERSVFELGMLYSQLSQHKLAEETLLDAEESASKLWGSDSIQVARAKNEIAVVLQRCGNFEKAADAAIESAKIRRAKLGDDSDLYAHSLLNVGIIRMSQKDYEHAATTLNLATKIVDKLGDSQQNMQLKTDVYSNLGTIELLRADFAKAEEAFQKLTATSEKFFGKEHPVHAGSLFKLAVAIGNQGRFEEAEPIMLESIAVQRKSLSPSHPDLIRSVQSYARLLEQLGRNAEAKSVLASMTGKDFNPANVAKSPGANELK